MLAKSALGFKGLMSFLLDMASRLKGTFVCGEAELVTVTFAVSCYFPSRQMPLASLREPERSGTGSAPRWKMKCHCPAAQEGRQTRILRLVPVRMLDIRARRRKGRLRMGIDVIVVTPPWEVMAHEPPLLDVKMSQFLSDDAGKSVKGPSAGPSATPACVLSSDGGDGTRFPAPRILWVQKVLPSVDLEGPVHGRGVWGEHPCAPAPAQKGIAGKGPRTQ
ncbi:hypothetical protein CB1_000490090 [Camelus ferus]|nr:hypothetical protein CB1_000490090 [Camelus ferus]